MVSYRIDCSPSSLTNQSFNRDTGNEISSLVALLDLFRVFRSLFLLFVHPVDLREPLLAKRARVLTRRPFFDANETKSMLAAIDVRKIKRLHVAHANTAGMHSLRFLLSNIVFVVVAGNLCSSSSSHSRGARPRRRFLQLCFPPPF